MKQTCILVLGMHRSGTSALTGLLHKLGVYLGSDLMGEHETNPKGFFENNKFYELNKRMLQEIGSSWDDVFYTNEKILKLNNCESVKKLIQSEFQYTNIFAIKDPRLVFLFPIYERALLELDIEIKIIIPYRNPIEVAKSLEKRNKIDTNMAFVLWVLHFIYAEKFSRIYKRVFIEFDDLIEKTENTISQIDILIGTELLLGYQKHENEIKDFLEPNLKHHNNPITNLSAKIPNIIRGILDLKAEFNSKSALEKFDILFNDWIDNHNLFYNKFIVEQRTVQEIEKKLAVNERKLIEIMDALNLTRVRLSEKDNQLHLAKDDLDQHQHELKIISSELSERDNNINRISQQIVGMRREIEAQKEELVSIYSSLSWRMTRPIRLIKRLLIKIFKI